MKRVFYLLCIIYVTLSCGSDVVEKKEEKPKEVQQEVIKVIQKDDVEQKEEEKEEIKEEIKEENTVKDIENSDVITHVYDLEEINENGEIKYFSKKLNKILESSDIFRTGILNTLKYTKGINIDGLNINKFILKDGYILIGDHEEVKLKLDDNKSLFKSGTELASIYKGEKLVPKKRRIDPNKKHIAFTFDDGPGNKNHVLIRELFNKYDETATFFFVGSSVKKHPEMVLKTYLDGHEIGNHTYNHPNLRNLSSPEIWKEISRTNDEIFKIIGVDGEYVRPPYGAFNNTVVNIIGGKRKVALWNVDSEDWKSRNVDTIISRVLDKVKDGDIVLFHDLYKESYESVSIMLPILKERGFQFVSYSEMLELRKNKYKGE